MPHDSKTTLSAKYILILTCFIASVSKEELVKEGEVVSFFYHLYKICRGCSNHHEWHSDHIGKVTQGLTLNNKME
jgi:hypothetical protein